MKDSIHIKGNKIIANISVVVNPKDNIFIGYIPSFDLPFTSPNREKVSEIASGLVNALISMWLKNGDLNLLREKLFKFNFIQAKADLNFISQSNSPSKAIRIQEELNVI